jgi:hypothetical protein
MTQIGLTQQKRTIFLVPAFKNDIVERGFDRLGGSNQEYRDLHHKFIIKWDLRKGINAFWQISASAGFFFITKASVECRIR